jgi:hypothetical protein
MRGGRGSSRGNWGIRPSVVFLAHRALGALRYGAWNGDVSDSAWFLYFLRMILLWRGLPLPRLLLIPLADLGPQFL